VFDNDTLAFVAVNEAATRQYGYTKDEFARMSLVDLYPREEVPELLETLRGRDPRNVVTRSVRQCRKDGSILDVQILASPLPNPQRTLRIVHAVDVSHRNRAEAALRESEERLRTIADNVPVLIGYIDAGERFQFANKTHEKWYGVPVEEYRGRHVREILGDDVYREHKPGFDTALSGRIVSEERRTRSQIREQYAYFTYLPHRGADGTVLGFYVLGYDVTERRKATEALAAERSLLRAVIDALPDRVYVKDRDRRYILVNAASLQSRGLSSHDEVVGRTAYDFFAREQAAAFEAEDEEVMRSDKPLLNREQSTVMPGDDVQWHLTNKVPLRAGGAVIGVIGVNRDVTGIRKATEAIRQLNAELEERVRERTAELEVANKELESFTYAVSHDLRAPLRSIDGFSRALLEDYRDRFDETGKDYLRRVRNATQRMGNLIDDLLTLSRITRSEIRQESVHLSAVAREIAAELQKDDPEREVEFDIHAGIRAKADPNLLRVALQNLLHNAWKFTGRAASAKIDVGTMRQRGRPVYYVRDNGAGFDMAYADRLFGAFQRLHSESEFPGTGVGLATVQRIVRRHGGEVWAEGAVDRGATFYFTLGQGRAAKGRDESSAETGAA
jgi:PAS domain S-box-containing protein